MSQNPPHKSESSKLCSRQESDNSSFDVIPPSVQLPKGGGAIRGMSEKFAVNSDIGLMTVAIASSL